LNRAIQAGSKITVIFFSVILLTSTVAISIHPAYSQTIPETGVLIMGPQKDAFLKDGNGNVNEGANSILQLKGNARPVIAFDQTLLEQTIEQRPIINATLRLFIEDVGGNLGSGQQTNLHKLNEFWEEGNAAKSGGAIRGTGSGVTWKCPVDSDISDNRPDCSIQWDGGIFNATVSDSITLSNSLEGQFIEFNLTGDVQSILNSGSTDFGWLMKKQNDEGAGTVSFTSKEGTANNPELIIHYDRPEAVLANEYLSIIDQLDTVGLSLNSANITPQLIDDITSDLNRTKDIVIELQNLGFDGQVNVTRVNQQMIGEVSFFDESTSETLFMKTIPNGTLGIFSVMGLSNEFARDGVFLNSTQITDLLIESQDFVNVISTFDDDEIASQFVLSSIGEFHPSTGNTFETLFVGGILVPVGIGIVFSGCMTIAQCNTLVTDLVTEGGLQALYFSFPLVTITGLKFEDVDGNGIQGNSTEEPGLPGWRFTMNPTQDFDILNPFIETFSNGTGHFQFFKINVPRPTTTIYITETSQPYSVVTTPGGLIQEIPFDADVDVPAPGFGQPPNVFEPPLIKFGNLLLPIPPLVDQVSTSLSPGTNGWYSGVKRIVVFDDTIFAFYYDGSNIVYKASTDNGSTWGPKQSVGTGVLNSSIGRWTIATDNSNHVVAFYYIPSGGFTQFKVIRGTVTNSTIAFDTPTQPLQVSPLGTGMASTGTATNGNIHFAFQYAGSATILRTYISTNSGSTWSQTSSSIDTTGNFPTAIAFTPLDSGKMLWTQGKSFSNDLFYRVYDGNSWGGQQQISNVYNCSSCAKQLSGGSNSTNFPSVAFLSNGNSGEIKVAKWDSNGGFIGVETAEDTLSHSLPSLTIDDSDVIHVYSISNNLIYETVNDGSWQGPTTPFGTTFDNVNQLTSAIDIPAVLWREGSSSPFDIRFGDSSG